MAAGGDAEADRLLQEGLGAATLEGEGEQGLVVEAEAAAPGMVGGVVSYDLREGR